MPAITEQELRKQLTGGELGRFYLLAGEEKLLLKRAARRLISKAAGDMLPEFNLNEFTSETEVERIVDAAVALPVMAERKCVAVADYDLEEKPQAQVDLLLELIADLPDTTTLVLYYPTLDCKNSAKWRKLMEAGKKAGYTVSFGRREAPELRRAIISAAERQGCVLPRDSADRLIEYAGPDMNLLKAEIEKLCAYALAQGDGRITTAMVEELTPKSTETTVFMMVNALLAEDYEKAYTLLDTLFYQNEEPIAVLGAMASSYVDIFRVKAALESGLTNEGPMEYSSDYKGKAFRLRNAERSGRRLSDSALRSSLELLLEADLALKGSRMEPRLVLEGLIGKLLLAARGKYHKARRSGGYA